MSLDSIKTSLSQTFGLSRADQAVTTQKTGNTAALREANLFSEVNVRQGEGENRPVGGGERRSGVSAFFHAIADGARSLKEGLARDFTAFKADPGGFVRSLFGGRSSGAEAAEAPVQEQPEVAPQSAVEKVVSDYRVDSEKSLSDTLKGATQAGPEAGSGILDKLIGELRKTPSQTLENQIDKAVLTELHKAPSYDAAATLIADFRAFARTIDTSGPEAADRALFLAAIDKAEAQTTDHAVATAKLSNDFKSELPGQVLKPGTFFRGTEATNVTLQRVLKNDSPAFLAKIDTVYRNALAKLENHPLTASARTDFEASNAPGAKNVTRTLDETSGLPVKQEIALQLAVELVTETFGNDVAGRTAFADLFGADSKAFFGSADTAIRGAFANDATTQKVVLDKWNSNNLILRGGGGVNSELKMELSRNDKKFESDVMGLVHAVITSAAGGVTGSAMSSNGEYRADARYTALITNISTTMSDIMQNRMR